MPYKNKEDANKYAKEWQKNRYAEFRKEAILKLGSVCISCRSGDNLEFDHIDPSTKSFNIGGTRSISGDRFFGEVDKCQLLCRVCHKDKTILERGQTPTKDNHGKRSSCMSGCRCKECRSSQNEYMKKYYADKRLIDTQ